MLRDYEAARELDRVSKLSAFNVAGATTRRRLNQHAAVYEFADGSRMAIHNTLSRGDAWHPEWRGTTADVHLGPIKGQPLQINR